jgi:CsoR family transcriptional regulator, copper-sensing transcriptional repressor
VRLLQQRDEQDEQDQRAGQDDQDGRHDREPDREPDGEPDREPDREERWEQRLAWPVLIAALVSVPAVFLTLLDEPYESVGTVVNVLTGVVLVGETVVLLWVSRDPVDWLRRHWWLVGLTFATVAAVVLALGPLQLLRLVRVFGALRIARAGRIMSAARKLQKRLGMSGWWSTFVAVASGLVVAAFVGVVLADPDSRSRQMVEDAVGGDLPFTLIAVVAGLLLFGATVVVLHRERD